MADEETPLLQPRSGGRSSSSHCAAADAPESPEPAFKRQRRASADSAGPVCASGQGSGGETEPLEGSAAAADEEEEVRQEEVGAEPGGAAAAVGQGGWRGADSELRRWGLARQKPPPPHRLQHWPWPSQGEGAKAAPARDAAETAIGCGPAQCSNGAAEAEAAPQADNILYGNEIVANGFHSCESDEDDRASHASSSDWTPRPRIGPYTFVQQHLMIGTDPRAILKDLLPETIPHPELDDMTLWQIVINILSEPPKRKKRKDINTIEDAVKLLQECKKIIVLTGAGVSVSCGIPDFRSRDGIYARLAVDFPDLPDPQAMFDIEYFRKDPRPFFKFAKVLLLSCSYYTGKQTSVNCLQNCCI